MSLSSKRGTLFAYRSDVYSLDQLDWLMEQDCIKKVVPVVNEFDDVIVFVFTNILMSPDQMESILKEWKINYFMGPILATCVHLKEVIFG